MEIDKVCPHCNELFKPTRNDARFCSIKYKQAEYRDKLRDKERCKLYTIGYQGRKLQEFISILKANGIKQLVDIRFSTISQMKSEFSEDALQYVLINAGISYRSLKYLGVPTKIKGIYKTSEMSIPEFERFYRFHVNDIDMIMLAKELKESGKTTLMCLERYAMAQAKQKINCHRSILADILLETREFTEVIHL